MIASITNFFAATYSEHFQFSEGAPVHDLLCLVYCIDPSIFTGKVCDVDTELKDEGHRGRTVIIEDSKTDEGNVWMAQTVHVGTFTLFHQLDLSSIQLDAMWNIFFDAVERCELVTPLHSN